MTQDSKPEWEISFDEKLSNGGFDHSQFDEDVDVKKVKSFISALLKSERERFLKAVESVPVRDLDNGLPDSFRGWNQAREEAIKRLKELPV